MEKVWVIVSMIVLAFSLGGIVGSETAPKTKMLRRQAVELGYARYNPTNGVWQWIETSTNK